MESYSGLLIYVFGSQDTEHSVLVQSLSKIKGLRAVKRISGTFLYTCSYAGSQDPPLSAVEAIIARECGLEVMLCSDIKHTSCGVRIRVEGMTCQSCVKLIESTILTQDGVVGIKVSLVNKEAFIVYDSLQTNSDEIAASIYNMGFDADVLETFTKLCNSPPASEQAVIHVEGMVCNSCVQNIETNIGKSAGVSQIKVSLNEKTAVVVFDPSLTSLPQLTEAIEDLGFEASSTEVACKKPEVEKCVVCLGIEEMTCQSCVKLIESTVGGLSGVMSVQVSLERKEGVVEYDRALINEEQIRKIIVDMGFLVTSIAGEHVH